MPIARSLWTSAKFDPEAKSLIAKDGVGFAHGNAAARRYPWSNGVEMGKPSIFSPSIASGCLRFARLSTIDSQLPF